MLIPSIDIARGRVVQWVEGRDEALEAGDPRVWMERFAPLGPVLVSPEDMPAPEDTVLECTVNGEVMQSAPLSDLIFPVPELVARLSAVATLMPGDLIFTGTPPGVGFGRTPRRYLRKGEVVHTSISGIGAMAQTCA